MELAVANSVEMVDVADGRQDNDGVLLDAGELEAETGLGPEVLVSFIPSKEWRLLRPATVCSAVAYLAASEDWSLLRPTTMALPSLLESRLGLLS